MAEVVNVSTQSQISSAMGTSGSSRVILVAAGAYTGGYNLYGKYFSLVCSGAIHSCVLTRQGRIMLIVGTSSGTIRLSGIHFRNGGTSSETLYGGALKIDSSELAVVSLEGCKFSSNQATTGAGIWAQDSGTTVNIYSTSFDGNSATSGDDIFVGWSASVTVHSTCPPDWIGSPAAGSDLDTAGDTISGTTKSFDIG